MRRTSVGLSPRAHRGFTLIELVAAIVIVGAIAAVATPMYRSLKSDARIAAMQGIEATMAANQQAAMNAYLARGSAGDVTCQGTTTHSVVVNGRTVSVWPSGVASPYVEAYPTGSPTGCGMFVMLGCGTAADAEGTGSLDCASLPDYGAIVSGFGVYMWAKAAGASNVSNCSIEYSGIYGYGSTYPADSDPVYGYRQSTWHGYYHAGYSEPGWTPPASTTCGA